MRLIKIIIRSPAVVWYKIRAWKVETGIILNSIGGLNKSKKRKKLISHKSEMKGINGYSLKLHFEFIIGFDRHVSEVYSRYCGRQSRKERDWR